MGDVASNVDPNDGDDDDDKAEEEEEEGGTREGGRESGTRAFVVS